ncbi:MAG TPA: outer membrane protein assembly factor BamE [Sphingomicrobium sp.]|nr:outer membrane protein assembly factor BamE [Sphingomicrobium sp.]
MKLGGVKTLVIATAVLLAGCAQLRQHKGVVLDSQLAAAIQPGVDNKDSVEKALGRPSFVGQFTPNDWYYVSRDVSQVAFRNPRITKQTVLIVRFDQKGNVASVQRTGKELVMNVHPTHRTTPTLGRKQTFFEELFGNIGSVSSGLPTTGGNGP